MTGGLDGLSGFEDTLPEAYLERIIKEKEKNNHIKIERQEIECISLNDLVVHEKIDGHIDFLTLDVGGAENEILRSLKLGPESPGNLEVAAFQVEVIPGRNAHEIRSWMDMHNYSGPWRIHGNHPDDIFIRKDLLPPDLVTYTHGIAIGCSEKCRCPVRCPESKWNTTLNYHYSERSTAVCSQTLWSGEKFRPSPGLGILSCEKTKRKDQKPETQAAHSMYLQIGSICLLLICLVKELAIISERGAERQQEHTQGSRNRRRLGLGFS